MISAAAVKEILGRFNRVDALLLRGARSIISSCPQNDVDIYISKSAKSLESFYNEIGVSRYIQTAPKQFKISMRSSNGELVIIDVFHDITWRGLTIIDVRNLQKDYISQLQVSALPPEFESWIIIMKNGLHGSSTPAEKIAGLRGMPEIWLTPDSSFWLRRLDVAMSKIAWNICTSPTVRFLDVQRLRILFILIKCHTSPLKAFMGFVEWVMFKVTRVFF